MASIPNGQEAKSPHVMDVGSVAEAVSASTENDVTDAPLYVTESLCMRCGENGVTRLLLTVIPNFRKTFLAAFECPHCGERNNEVQFAGELQPQGCNYSLEVSLGDRKILNRQVVKSETATIKIPELDFEIPPEAQRGSMSTIEGVLMRAANELEALQEERKRVDPQMGDAIDKFLAKLRACAVGELPFTFVVDDPSGNSYIENPLAPSPDPSLTIKFYERTSEQQESMGYLVNTAQTNNGPAQVQNEPHGSVGAIAAHRAIAQGNSAEMAAALFKYSAPEEVMIFPTTCGACATKCECRMYFTNIPYFQQVIVMASSCDSCGYRNSELKPGGSIPPKGKKIVLHVENVRDFSRDVIKSDTAAVTIPEIELELTSGTIGGSVTTVEGLVRKISESIESIHGFSLGDSLEENSKNKWLEFRTKLNKLLSLEKPFTLVIDDALSNSFVAPVTDDIKDDHQLTTEEYERSWEQNEELGINDMDTTSADAAYNNAD